MAKMTSSLKISSRGVALLISLSVIALLSIGLTKTFEKKSVEVAHLANSLSRFQAETLARSVFRAVIIAIKKKGLAFIVKNQNQWRELPIPIANGHFIIDQIRSIDHLFYVNQPITKDSSRMYILLNLVNFIRKDQQSLDQEMIDTELFPLIGDIIDWTDSNDEPNRDYFSDGESYPDERPEFEVKNRDFERLSELKLLPEFRKLRISAQNLEKHFRVAGKISGTYMERVDVNTVEKEEMEAFLEKFKNVSDNNADYTKVYINRSEIIDRIFEEDENQERDKDHESIGEHSFADAKPRFEKQEEVKEMITQALGELNSGEIKIQELFSIRTDYLSIHYRVTVNKATLKIKAIVELTYQGSSLNIDKFKILQFKIIR